MRTLPVIGIILIALGVIALVYDGIPVRAERESFEIGPIEGAVERREEYEVPKAVAVGAIVGGAALIAFGRKSSR
jgi:hypothetical protein